MPSAMSPEMEALVLGDPKGVIDRAAKRDLIKTLVASLALGVGVRGIAGIHGNISRNIRRKRDRDEAEAAGSREITFDVPAVKASGLGGKPRPDWFVPALATGTPAAMWAGWTGTSKAMKHYRKWRDKQELEKAKAEFESALSDERGSKLACDLRDLSGAYARGEIDNELKKIGGVVGDALDTAGTFVSGATPLLYTLMAISALGGGTLGWKLNKPKRSKELEAYRESMRRRRVNRPISLVARSRSNPEHERTSKPEVKDEYEPEESRKAAGWGTSVLKHLATATATAPLVAYGTSRFLTGTQHGRNFLGDRSSELMKDPKYVRRLVDSMTSNPEMMATLYDRIAPMLRQEVVRRHPWMGRLTSRYI